MSVDRMEEALDSVASKQLSEQARRDLRSAVIAADVSRCRPWWRRSVPLWQMAAACVVVSVLSFWTARSGSLDGVSVPSGGAGVAARIESPGSDRATSSGAAVVRFEHRPAYRPDITRWRPVAANSKGV